MSADSRKSGAARQPGRLGGAAWPALAQSVPASLPLALPVALPPGLLQRRAEGISLTLAVTPKARRPGITGCKGAALKIGVAQAPEDGRATEAVLRLLADAFALPRAHVRLLSGATARAKVVALDGDAAVLEARLVQLLSALLDAGGGEAP